MKHFRAENSSLRVTNQNVIAEIEKYIHELYHASVKLCFPTMKKQRKQLHFIIMSDKPLDLSEFASLVKYIRDRVDFGNIFVQSREYWENAGEFNRAYSHEVDYSANNHRKVEDFLLAHYPNFTRLRQLYKEHGVPSSCFDEDEFDEMLRADLGGAIREICDAALGGQSEPNEDTVITILVGILKKAGQCGLDTEKIVGEIKQDESSIVPNKLF